MFGFYQKHDVITPCFDIFFTKEHVKNTISEINDMNVDFKNYFEIHAEGIFDNVIRERDNVNPFLRKRQFRPDAV